MCACASPMAALRALSLSLSLFVFVSPSDPLSFSRESPSPLRPTTSRLDRCSVSPLVEKRRDASSGETRVACLAPRAHVRPISARTCRVATTLGLVGVRNVLVTLEERLERLSKRREFAVAGSVSWRLRSTCSRLASPQRAPLFGSSIR